MPLDVFISAATGDFGDTRDAAIPNFRATLAQRIEALATKEVDEALKVDECVKVNYQDALAPYDSQTLGNLVEAIRAASLVIHVIGPKPGNVVSGDLQKLPALISLDRSSKYASHIWQGIQGCTYTQFEARIALLLGVKLLVFKFEKPGDVAAEHLLNIAHLHWLSKVPDFHHYPLAWHPQPASDKKAVYVKAVDALYAAICSSIRLHITRPKQEAWRGRRIELLTVDPTARGRLPPTPPFQRERLTELILGGNDSRRLFTANACSGKSMALTWADGVAQWSDRIIALYRCSETSLSTRRLGYFVQSIAAQLQKYVRGPDLNYSEETVHLLSNERMRPRGGELLDSAFAKGALMQVFEEILEDGERAGAIDLPPHFGGRPTREELPPEAILVVDGADELLGKDSGPGGQLLKFIWSFPWPPRIRVVITAQPSLQPPELEDAGENEWVHLDLAAKREAMEVEERKLLDDEQLQVAVQIVKNAFTRTV